MGNRGIDREIELPGHGRIWLRDIPGPAPDAPAVLLLHGLGATARLNFGPSFRPLSAHFRVLAVDHRGHGRGLPTRRFRLSQCADDAILAAEAAGVTRLVAVGYSMGGPIASLAWRRHRERVAGLVLCATARHFASRGAARAARILFPAVARAARVAPEAMRRRMLARLLSRIEHPAMRERVSEEYARHRPATVLQAAAAVGSFSSRDWIGEVDVPTAVVITLRDTMVRPERQRKLAASIPGARVFEVDGDHDACIVQTDRFVPALVAACGDVAERSGPWHPATEPARRPA